jgi:hypothetical protein
MSRVCDFDLCKWYIKGRAEIDFESRPRNLTSKSNEYVKKVGMLAQTDGCLALRITAEELNILR